MAAVGSLYLIRASAKHLPKAKIMDLGTKTEQSRRAIPDDQEVKAMLDLAKDQEAVAGQQHQDREI